ncbi:GNAT family N-acetyltransferase [Streptomyces sp. NPDC001595]|uniref:GNAT family N-acetyltransferase n=1 Tax=Streptomyces sp. NPDC001532 TaxID=3154520 RepID=UPI00332D80B0
MSSTSTQPTTLRVFSRAADLPREAWAGLLRPEDLFLGDRWLEVAERTAGCPMRYLLLDRAGETVAGLATALADDTAPWVLGRPDTMLEAAAADGREGAAEVLAALPGPAADSLLPTLVCGGRHMGRSRVPRRPDTGRAEVEALVARAEELAAEQGARSVAFPFVEDGDTVLRQVLRERGYLVHEAGRYSSLTVDARGFDGYLERLSSAKRRRRVLAERRRIAAAGVELRLAPLSAELIPRLGELEEQLMGKYGVTWTAAQTEQVLREMLAEYGSDARVVLAEAEGGIRGFATLLHFRGHWYARQTGFDYDYQQRHNLALYFETVYYFPVEAAARLGIEAVHYGLGSEEAKASRGCTAETHHAHLLPLAP